LRDVEAADGRRQARVLRREWIAFRRQDLQSGTNNDPVWLRISPVAGVARRVDNARSALVVHDRGASVIAAIRIGFREAKPATFVNFCDHAVIASGDGIGGINHRSRVGIRDIDGVNGRKVSHERHDPAVGREVKRDLRFGRKAGDHLIAGRVVPVRAVGHFERVDQLAGRLELIEHDFRGDAEAGVSERIVPDIGISAVIRRGHAIGSDAVGRQLRPHGDVCRIVVVNGATEQQISLPELNTIVVGESNRGSHGA
jgi:hypothetical protein